ncbi:hypothetical protein [Blastococcus sp. TF02A-35]|uniref:hypothetical protein n=1 Tax=Blastococcus sp. TF02A-35 TaxID=2559612 RepID=UPI0010734219|nr:hypothetical protein [Blastococcus sp. TF02A_35]TFV51822.1 hypothetical protein E4P43_09100 [Blastococcus sp. TF02A_35]
MTDGQQWGQPPVDPGAQQGPYGQPPYYGQPQYGQSPYYGQPQYGQPPYGQPPYYGQPYQPYGQPAYPGPGGWPGAAWPHGPGRPGAATTATVFGFVTGGLTAFGSLVMLLAVLAGDADGATLVLALGLPCAVGLVVGGARLLQRRSTKVLFWSAIAALAVLAAALLTAVADMPGDEAAAVAAFVLMACVLPVVTAVLSRVPTVTGWADSA